MSARRDRDGRHAAARPRCAARSVCSAPSLSKSTSRHDEVDLRREHRLRDLGVRGLRDLGGRDDRLDEPRQRRAVLAVAATAEICMPWKRETSWSTVAPSGAMSASSMPMPGGPSGLSAPRRHATIPASSTGSGTPGTARSTPIGAPRRHVGVGLEEQRRRATGSRSTRRGTTTAVRNSHCTT